ncbi:NodT family efflux transporter outer membrane factor (OMF) lipoprotein [Pseudomonas duriflava]|uniref:NodT family efflux transporter outer membrane factor (OMF) lipoprotein n=1 Tax=Pseudomonas duriflava TaxID=459528 RepID=A0A562Q6Y6_9PSED|nr:efflux transporter outer membrane subunit [Pseudomonas duriflava]TWI52478.1 NodT family efflux transporter outer membrane factor (OMF) lipoprotein [Pseudomonas duriflava]
MRRCLLIATVAALAGCTVGPKFHTPDAVLPPTWQAPTVDVNSVTVNRPFESAWWTQFNDPLLTSLVQQAAASNLDLALADSRLEQSRSLIKIAGADTRPALAANGSYQRERNSQQGLNDPSGHEGKSAFDLWQYGVSASWELDLWGRVRHSLEAANAGAALSEADRNAVALSIAAETATNYLRLRGVQATLDVTRQNLDIARQSQQLTQTRFENGVTTQLDTANAAAQVATLEARLPLLEAEEVRLINALSYLLGQAPNALRQTLAVPRDIPAPPSTVPVGIPSELARRRPDIQRAEAALHRATATVGIAKADFYPRLSLGGSAGFQALEGSNLGLWSARQWSLGPSLYLPIFQGGRLSGTLELRERQQQEAALDYRRTVLAAWHEVEDALVNYAAEQRHHEALMRAVAQNKAALETARARYKEGAIDFINVLNVQRELIQTQSALVDSATRVSTDLVVVYKALAGGWPEPKSNLASQAASIPR